MTQLFTAVKIVTSCGCCVPHQQTTVEEQSHIKQLEEELSLKRAEIHNLLAQLKGQDSTSEQGAGPSSQQAVQTAGHEQSRASSEMKEKNKAELAPSQKQMDNLKTLVDKQNQELSELKKKVQEANKENLDMMENWKVWFGWNLHSQREQLRQSYSVMCPDLLVTSHY